MGAFNDADHKVVLFLDTERAAARRPSRLGQAADSPGRPARTPGFILVSRHGADTRTEVLSGLDGGASILRLRGPRRLRGVGLRGRSGEWTSATDWLTAVSRSPADDGHGGGTRVLHDEPDRVNVILPIAEILSAGRVPMPSRPMALRFTPCNTRITRRSWCRTESRTDGGATATAAGVAASQQGQPRARLPARWPVRRGW